MATREIPREEWKPFFDAFSVQHEHWLTTIEVMSPDIGDQIEAHELPLEGISCESRDGEEIIYVSAGEKPADHVTHSIHSPTRVYHRTGEEDEEALEILSKSEGTSLIRLHRARELETRRAGG